MDEMIGQKIVCGCCFVRRCVFEIYIAIDMAECKLDVIMPPIERESFNKALTKEFGKIFTALSKVDLRNAQVEHLTFLVCVLETKLTSCFNVSNCTALNTRPCYCLIKKLLLFQTSSILWLPILLQIQLCKRKVFACICIAALRRKENHPKCMHDHSFHKDVLIFVQVVYLRFHLFYC